MNDRFHARAKLAALLLGALCVLPSRADIVWPDAPVCKPECVELILQARARYKAQDWNGALDKFEAAAKADPQAGDPAAHLAQFWGLVAYMKGHPNAREYALQWVERAKSLQSQSNLLTNAQTMLSMTQQSALRESKNPKANELMNEGEAFYVKKQYRQALEKYQAAFALDSDFAIALTYIADCHLGLDNPALAESYYRKSLALQPDNFRTWTFLSTALANLGRPSAEIKEVLYRALNLNPGYRLAWHHLALASKDEETPLKVFKPEILATLRDKQMNISEKAKEDMQFWLAYVMFSADVKKDKSGQAKASVSPYRRELDAWREALKLQEKPSQHETIKNFNEFTKANQLEAAVFLFRWQPEFQADFNEWSKKNPNGLREFVERFKLIPENY